METLINCDEQINLCVSKKRYFITSLEDITNAYEGIKNH